MGKFVLNEKNSLWYLLSNKGSKNLEGGEKGNKKCSFSTDPFVSWEPVTQEIFMVCEGKILRGFIKHTQSIVPKIIWF